MEDCAGKQKPFCAGGITLIQGTPHVQTRARHDVQAQQRQQPHSGPVKQLRHQLVRSGHRVEQPFHFSPRQNHR
jgi:hypothetical protein